MTRCKIAPLLVALILLQLAACAHRSEPRSPVPRTIIESAHPASTLPHAQTLAFHALSLVGTPYRYGGESPQQGFDCSGFMRFIYRDALGKTLPRTAQAQSQSGKPVDLARGMRLGDLVFFAESDAVTHVGLYVGESRFVHAPRTGKAVQLSSLSGYWRHRLVSARRYL